MNRLAPALAALLLASCATTAAVPTAAAPSRSPCEYYPLEVGNRWVYDGPPGQDNQPSQLAVTIIGSRDGYFQDDKKGNLACTAEGLRDGKRYLLQGPLEKGHGWSNVTSVGTTEHFEISEVGQPVTVPAGSFTETVTVVSRDRIDADKVLELRTVYARGVGMIRLQTLLLTKGQEIPQVTAVLRSFQAAPAPGPAKP